MNRKKKRSGPKNLRVDLFFYHFFLFFAVPHATFLFLHLINPDRLKPGTSAAGHLSQISIPLHGQKPAGNILLFTHYINNNNLFVLGKSCVFFFKVIKGYMDNITRIKYSYPPQCLAADIKDDDLIDIFIHMFGKHFCYIDLWIVDGTQNGISLSNPVRKPAIVQFHVGIAKFDRLPGGQDTLESAGSFTEKDEQSVFIFGQVRIALHLT